MGREAAARAELNRQTAAANKELQELQALKKDTERRDEVLAKLAELQAAAANPWLNEDPQQAASSMSPTRVRRACCRPRQATQHTETQGGRESQ